MATKRRRVQAPKARPAERQRPAPVLWAALAGGLAAVALIVLSTAGGLGDGGRAKIIDGAATAALLRGIPQDGTMLGDPEAPVTVVEYADLQCPYCKTFALDTLPRLIDEYVRPGKVRLEFRGLAFLGQDSVEALRAVLAAGRQDRLWNVMDLLYANQGQENSGWVTTDLLRAVGAAVPGLDVERMLSEAATAPVQTAIERAQAQAAADGIEGTPSFTVARTGAQKGKLIGAGAIGIEAFRPEIDALLAE